MSRVGVFRELPLFIDNVTVRKVLIFYETLMYMVISKISTEFSMELLR